MSLRLRLAALLTCAAAIGICWQLGAAEETATNLSATSTIFTKLQQDLGGVDRYLTYVSTDKPIYRPGEKVYVRAPVLHYLTHKPLADAIEAAVQIIGPKGDVVASGTTDCQDGVLAFAWEIPAEQAGGQYKLKVTHPWKGDAPAERKFDIRAYHAPRLRTQIKFLRDGYGPGDEVVATLEATRAEGGFPSGAKVTIVARVDGAEAYRGDAAIDVAGRCSARFNLPQEMARGEGSLAMVIEDGGVLETAGKTIPILLQTVDVHVYPEGGDLVAGLPNRVYFEAFTPAQKPADLAGVLVDAKGQEVATFRSTHEGRGRFTFTPTANVEYKLKITEPAGIRTMVPLPNAKASGVIITSLSDVFTQTARLQVMSADDKSVVLTLNKRGEELDRKQVKLEAAEPHEVELLCGDASGVLTATVWDSENKPLAERLVFTKPRRELRVIVSSDRPRYVPGGKAAVSIRTTDRAGKPVSGLVGITVTDDSVLEMIEEREQAPRLPVMVMLEPDVKDLADAHVYLDGDNEEAPEAVDLLLGTQGWRRFAFVDVATFMTKHGDRAARALALRVAVPQETLLGAGSGVGGRRWRFMAEDRFGSALQLRDAVPTGTAIRQPADADEQFGNDKNKWNVVNGPAVNELQENRGKVLAEPQPAAGPLQLAQLGDVLAEVDAQDEFRRELMPFGIASAESIASDMIAVRVFAHSTRPNRQPGERFDFAETLFWHAGIKTDDDGKATVEFDLSDAITSFRIFADAFSGEGALGSATATIASVEPFYIEPKLPLEVTSGDVVLAPVSLVNSTGEALNASLSVVSAFKVMENNDLSSIKLPADGRTRKLVRIPVSESYGTMPVVTVGSAESLTDSVTRTMTVKPLGFPIEHGCGGVIEANAVADYIIEIPASVVPGSVRAKAVVYPTPLASLTEALERLIQEPSGCFEQTSSTVYPLIMAQQYFFEHEGVDPSLIERSAAMLESGYERLIGFEAKSGGFEWFGSDPGHDALTAYGLMEFTDMARVRAVDPQMLARTKKWFLAQRDGKGGFARRTHTLHSWVAEPEVANAYNTWAALKAGIDGDFTKEVEWVRNSAERTENTYVIALAANVMAAAGESDAAARLLDKLAGRQKEDGSLDGATTSVVGSSGEALVIETTSLAVLAWLYDDAYTPQVEKGIRYLAECCKAGRFASTQATVLALKAITAFDRARATPKAPGELRLLVDGEPVGEPVAFTPETQGTIQLPNFASLLTPGRHQVELHMTGGSQMPFSVAVDFFSTKPESSDDCKLQLDVELSDTKVNEGEFTEANVTVENRADGVVPTPIAIIGIPGGLEVQHDQLKELAKSGKIATYEVRGRDLVLYWRSFAAAQRVELPVRLVAAIPGSYAGPASRAYLYYTDEHKMWADGLKVDIQPAQ